MSENLNPETFDLEAWLTDASLPEESVGVYKRADVVAEITELQARIETERAAEGENAERTVGSKSKVRQLERKYEALLKTFGDSLVTVYVRALTRDELKDLRTTHEKRTEGWEPKAANEAFGYDLLAAAIVGMRPAGEDRMDAKLTVDQVKALENAIGAAQVSQILAARQQAQNGVPRVDADFLLKSSGTSAGTPE